MGVVMNRKRAGTPGIIHKMSASSLCIISDNEQDGESLAQSLCLHTVNCAEPLHSITIHTGYEANLIAQRLDETMDCRNVIYMPSSSDIVEYAGILRKYYSVVRALSSQHTNLIILDVHQSSTKCQTYVDEILGKQSERFELPINQELELLSQYQPSEALTERMDQLKQWKQNNVHVEVLMPTLNQNINLPCDPVVPQLVNLLCGNASSTGANTAVQDDTLSRQVAFFRDLYKTDEDDLAVDKHLMKKPPNVHWPPKPGVDDIQLTWRFTFPSCPLPKPIFDRILGRAQQTKADSLYRWQNGILITHDPLRICIVKRYAHKHSSSTSPPLSPSGSSHSLHHDHTFVNGNSDVSSITQENISNDVTSFDLSLRIDPDELSDITEEMPLFYAWRYFGYYLHHCFELIDRIPYMPYQLHLLCHGHVFYGKSSNSEHVFHVTELLAALQESKQGMTSFTEVNDENQEIKNQLNTAMCFSGERPTTIRGFREWLSSSQLPSPPRSPAAARDFLGSSLYDDVNTGKIGEQPRRSSFTGRRVSFGVVAVQGVTVKSIEDPVAATNLFALGFVQDCFSDLFDSLTDD